MNVVTVQAVSFIFETIDLLPVDIACYQAMIVDRAVAGEQLLLGPTHKSKAGQWRPTLKLKSGPGEGGS